MNYRKSRMILAASLLASALLCGEADRDAEIKIDNETPDSTSKVSMISDGQTLWTISALCRYDDDASNKPLFASNRERVVIVDSEDRRGLFCLTILDKSGRLVFVHNQISMGIDFNLPANEISYTSHGFNWRRKVAVVLLSDRYLVLASRGGELSVIDLDDGLPVRKNDNMPIYNSALVAVSEWIAKQFGVPDGSMNDDTITAMKVALSLKMAEKHLKELRAIASSSQTESVGTMDGGRQAIREVPVYKEAAQKVLETLGHNGRN